MTVSRFSVWKFHRHRDFDKQINSRKKCKIFMIWFGHCWTLYVCMCICGIESGTKSAHSNAHFALAPFMEKHQITLIPIYWISIWKQIIEIKKDNSIAGYIPIHIQRLLYWFYFAIADQPIDFLRNNIANFSKKEIQNWQFEQSFFCAIRIDFCIRNNWQFCVEPTYQLNYVCIGMEKFLLHFMHHNIYIYIKWNDNNG